MPLDELNELLSQAENLVSVPLPKAVDMDLVEEAQGHANAILESLSAVYARSG